MRVDHTRRRTDINTRERPSERDTHTKRIERENFRAPAFLSASLSLARQRPRRRHTQKPFTSPHSTHDIQPFPPQTKVHERALAFGGECDGMGFGMGGLPVCLFDTQTHAMLSYIYMNAKRPQISTTSKHITYYQAARLPGCVCYTMPMHRLRREKGAAGCKRASAACRSRVCLCLCAMRQTYFINENCIVLQATTTTGTRHTHDRSHSHACYRLEEGEKRRARPI